MKLYKAREHKIENKTKYSNCYFWAVFTVQNFPLFVNITSVHCYIQVWLNYVKLNAISLHSAIIMVINYLQTSKKM